MKEKLHHYERIYTGRDIIEHDPGAFWQSFELSDGWRLEDVEDSKKYKTGKKSFPCQRDRNQSDELARDLVDHNEAGIFLSRGSCDLRGGRDAYKGYNDSESHGGGSACRKRQKVSQRSPEKRSCRGRPATRARASMANAEKGRRERGPARGGKGSEIVHLAISILIFRGGVLN